MMSELPMLPDADINEKVNLSKNNLSPTELAYEQFRLDQKNKKGMAAKMQVPVITLEMLEIAPKDFFHRFEALTKETTSAIIASISSSNRSIAIAKHKSDPTNIDVKREIVMIVSYEFSQYEKKNSTVKSLSPDDKDILLALVTNEVIGLGPLEPLWNDNRITEIMVNGPSDIQVEIKGIVRPIESVRFRNKEHLMALIEKLYSSINKQVSPTNPSERGRLHDNSRMYAVHEIIAPNGPNFNIRKHNEKYWTPLDIIGQGTASPELMHYIGGLIHSGVSFAIAGGTGTGKALTLDTELHTPNGPITMGDIKVGDKVFDRFGSVVNVINKFEQEPNDVYRVHFESGAHIDCDINHNWLVSDINTRKRNISMAMDDKDRVTNYNNVQLETIKRLIETTTESEVTSITDLSKEIGVGLNASIYQDLTYTCKGPSKLFNKLEMLNAAYAWGIQYKSDQSHKHRELYNVKTTGELLSEGVVRLGKNNFQVPLLKEPVVYENGLTPDELPIHPYLFGLWLGDGSSYRAKIASMEEDAHEYIRVLSELGVKDALYQGGDHPYLDWRINDKDFTKKLRSMGLMEKKKGGNKFIPDEYLYSSVESRKLLLAGLIDSDGSVSSKSRIWEFGNTSKDLVDGFVKISSSLGYKARLPEGRRKKFKSNNGEIKLSKMFWSVTICTNDVLSKLPRKIEKHQANKPIDIYQDISITKIEKLDRVEVMACITVDGEDSTYLAGDFHTVTHNTTLMNALTGFIPNNARVITLEENLEMKPHPKKLIAAPMECVPAKAGEGKEFGVTMRDLVRSSLQMRPEYIIIGEVSDGAAYDLCQALNTGHSGGSTVHANDAKDSINRLRSLVSQEDFVRGPAVLDLIGSAFDVIIVVDRLLDGSRKISEIVEIGREPKLGENGELTLEILPLWEMITEEVIDENGQPVIIADWVKVGELSEYRQRKHRLNLAKPMSWDELLEISTYNVPIEQRESGDEE